MDDKSHKPELKYVLRAVYAVLATCFMLAVVVKGQHELKLCGGLEDSTSQVSCGGDLEDQGRALPA
jgi:hypothetical protein